jgi:hypothetical protein
MQLALTLAAWYPASVPFSVIGVLGYAVQHSKKKNFFERS